MKYILKMIQMNNYRVHVDSCFESYDIMMAYVRHYFPNNISIEYDTKKEE